LFEHDLFGKPVPTFPDHALVIATGGGWLALKFTGSLQWLFTAIACGLLAYGVLVPTAIIRGAWSLGSAAKAGA
jgi:hypothetical protein